MKTEEFDSIFKQKLDTLNPEFQEKDWLRLQMKMQGRNRKIAAYLTRILLGLLALAFMGAAIWFMRDSRPASTNEQLNNTGNKSVQVFATELPAGSSQENVAAAGDLPESATASGHFSKSQSAAGFSQLVNAHKTLQKNPVHIAAADELDSASAERSLSTKNAKESGRKNEADESSFLTPSAPESAETHADKQLIKSADEQVKSLPVTTTSFLVSKSELTDHSFSTMKALKGQAISRWKAGIGFLITQSHYTAGVRAEMRLNNNISLQSGIMQQHFFLQEYSNQLEFESDHSVEFNELAIPRHSKTTEFTNIRIHSTDWVMPLEFKYTYPFSTSASIYLSGGLQLSLKSKTLLDFDYLSYDTNELLKETGLDQAYNSATLINNFIFGIGYQRNFRKLSAQIGCIYQKNNSNLPSLSKKDWGLQAAISYAF